MISKRIENFTKVIFKMFKCFLNLYIKKVANVAHTLFNNISLLETI